MLGVYASATATGGTGSSQGAWYLGTERPSSKDRRTRGGTAAGEARSSLRSSILWYCTDAVSSLSLGGKDDSATAAAARTLKGASRSLHLHLPSRREQRGIHARRQARKDGIGKGQQLTAYAVRLSRFRNDKTEAVKLEPALQNLKFECLR